MRFLSEDVLITKVSNPSTAATGAVNGTGVDMTGYRGVMFVTSFTTANAGNYINAAESTASTTGYTDLEGTKVASGSSDEDVWVDVYGPKDQYVRCEVVRAGASTALGDIWAFQYDPISKPVDNTTTGTITGETHVQPSTGTA
jgi:hypothetical protein